MEEYPKPPNTVVLSTGVLVVVIAMVAGIAAFSKKDPVATSDVEVVADDATPTATATPTVTASGTTATPTPTATAVVTIYKNGSYTATGTYSTPGGEEGITVNLTIANDVVTAASVNATGHNPDSRQYQGQFVSGYKQQVIGKKLIELQVGRVSGSSLTPKGFNNAVNAIRTQAKS